MTKSVQNATVRLQKAVPGERQGRHCPRGSGAKVNSAAIALCDGRGRG